MSSKLGLRVTAGKSFAQDDGSNWCLKQKCSLSVHTGLQPNGHDVAFWHIPLPISKQFRSHSSLSASTREVCAGDMGDMSGRSNRPCYPGVVPPPCQCRKVLMILILLVTRLRRWRTFHSHRLSLGFQALNYFPPRCLAHQMHRVKSCLPLAGQNILMQGFRRPHPLCWCRLDLLLGKAAEKNSNSRVLVYRNGLLFFAQFSYS